MNKEKLKNQNDKKDNFSLKISKSGIYAYLAICSICLSELFPDDWNIEFNKKCIKKLCKYLKVDENQEIVMMKLLEDKNGHTIEPYLLLLLNEPTLNGKISIIKLTLCVALENGEYDARQRVLIIKLAKILKIPYELIQLYEHSLVKLLNTDESFQTENEKEALKHRKRIKNIKRYASVGIATLAGGTIIGLTGGLAAPLIGAGIGTIIGGAGAGILASTTGIAVIGSLFGVAGAGLTGYKMKKRVGQIEEFSFKQLGNKLSKIDSQLHIAIAITGWLKSTETNEILETWNCLSISKEQYALKYESKYLIELGQVFEYIFNIAVSFAAQETLKYTILGGLMSAIAWPTALLSMSSIIDNPWSVCCRRSSEVGKHLAHVLLNHQHGKRPITLIGYSLGARVIFYCLREMEEIGGENAYGIIQDAILLGAPVTINEKQWNNCTKIVAGKIINGYSQTDWLLRFLYRTFSMTTGVAGLAPLNYSGIENINLNSIVKGHNDYYDKLNEIIELIDEKIKISQFENDKNLLIRKLCRTQSAPQLSIIN